MRGIGVLIRPLGTVPPEVLHAIRSDLIAELDCAVTLGAKLPLPMRGYVRQRKQYMSSVILKGLERSSDRSVGHKVLGVTTQDLFASGRNFVFGQAIVSGKAAVISTRRLEVGGESLGPRASKEAIHEIGHTMGLAHCGDKTCVMSFSATIESADKKAHRFCDYCVPKLGLGFAENDIRESG